MDASGPFGIFGDSAATMLSVLVFLAAGTLAFAVMIGVRAREAVRRRAAARRSRRRRRRRPPGAALFGTAKAAQKLVEYATKHYASLDSTDVKLLRRRLIQAGIYDDRAAGLFLHRACG